MPTKPARLAHKRQRRDSKAKDLQAQELARNGAVILGALLTREGEPNDLTAAKYSHLARRALLYAFALEAEAKELVLPLGQAPALPVKSTVG